LFLLLIIKEIVLAEVKKKPLNEVFDQGLEKLVMISPNKKTYDELTSIMFQLYCGNDFGMGNFSLQFLDKTERAWRQGRKKVAKNLGLSLVKNV
jgi:hypothetical protein|tara:strand:+ start:1602 stop:1883 length:282 start_codon:yes stop_codon:yes gene_type:complete